ncbi:hypothetical protein BGZ99_001184 [Dissophora globulifera]|uniref:Uncharacterized protein n=1 Tax=Dissophora globulifera TaxID=979702 RepID=A0A9P6UY58_9FUNG|nr:hypothetical protein BGZ99_001184 [Dissophora globulifera]
MLSVIHPSSALCLQPSPSEKSLLVATGASARIPQPYGVIPPRKRNHATGRPRSASASLPLATTPLSKKSFSLPSTRASLDLAPATASSTVSQSLFHSFHNLLLSDSTLTQQPSFWASLKAQCLNTTSSLPWLSGSSSNSNGHADKRKDRGSKGCARDFAPPIALRVSNSSPIVTLNATPLVASSSTDDSVLSLPNVDSLSWPGSSNSSSATSSSTDALLSGDYPVSVAAMDKFKVMRTDIIPLKTFTYSETFVADVNLPTNPAAAARSAPLVKRSVQKDPSSYRSGVNIDSSSNNNNNNNNNKATDDVPLPRHLASRETRSNSDYLRMMASELRMIRARKLIAPLKPRGYLLRRKDLFRNVKSSLSVSTVMPNEEDDHPLFVGSWSSVSTTRTFLSALSSDYATAEEELL